MKNDEEVISNISKRVNSVLDLRLENDKETLLALKELSNFFPENTIQSRRKLLSKIEKRSLCINKVGERHIQVFNKSYSLILREFLSAFRLVKLSLDRIYEDVSSMCDAVQNMTSQLKATRTQTHNLIKQTTKLKAESNKLSMQEEVAEAFLKSFQLNSAELIILRDSNITEDFFAVLELVHDIHSNCRTLMQCGNQTSALDIMDQMTSFQEVALERLYKWAQSHCKNIESAGTGQLLTKAMSKLQDREILFKYVIGEYCTHRRSILVRLFVDALTKGGPGGVPKPIEMHADDPKRYVADMLAFLHQALPSENENLLTLLKGCDKIDVTEQVQEALGNISEGVCTPLRVRIEHIISSPEVSIKDYYSITNMLLFYKQTFQQELGGNGGLTNCLRELSTEAGNTCLEKLSNDARSEAIENISGAPSNDLSPSPALLKTLDTLGSILAAPVFAHDSHQDYINKIVACVFDPLLQAVNISASRLLPTDMAVYLLNCLYQMQSSLALYEFLDERLERLQAQCDAQLDTLTSEQASSFVANLNLGPIYTILQESGKEPLSQVPGMQPSSLSNFIGKFDSFLSMPALLLLPQINCLSSSTHRVMIQKRSTEVIIAIYKQLYTSVRNPTNGYTNPELLVPRTPEEVSNILIGENHLSK